MPKNVLIILAVILILVWIVSWFRVPAVVATAAAQPWPGGMGTLDSVAGRYPPIKGNDAAMKLTALANALPKNDAIANYVGHEIARGDLDIGKPPALADVSAIRDLLLHDQVVWERPGGVRDIGDQATYSQRVVQMTVTRALIASALAKAREQDSAAWEDLHAAWNLARSLDPQPEVMTQTAALSMLRMINAVAWKMPLPAPPWFAELQQYDDVRRMLEAFQYQTASYRQVPVARLFPTKWLADAVEHDRKIAEALINETHCDVNTSMNNLGVDLSSIWSRAFRYRAEREATANALRIRRGKSIDAASRCSDGTWSFDGTTLRFSRDIATTATDKAMPLRLRVQQQH